VQLYQEFLTAKAVFLEKYARKSGGDKAGERDEEDEPPFHWQQYLTKGIWADKALRLLQSVQQGDWPFAHRDAMRIKERRNPFARRIFSITPWEHRLQLDMAHFRAARSYFLGAPLRPPLHHPMGKVGQDYKCFLTNHKGKQCPDSIDAWGDGAFTCRHSSRHAEHNAIRDALADGTRSVGYLTAKEVWMDEWQHRIDVGVREIEEEGDLPTHLDVTIRAFVKKGVTHANPDRIYEQAAKDKRREHPQKDKDGRHKVQGQFVPFVMSTFGGMGKDAQKFLRKCARRDPARTEHMKDVISAQHAHWIADRLIRAIGPHAIVASHATATAQESTPTATRKQQRAASVAFATASGKEYKPKKSGRRQQAAPGKKPV